MNSDERIDSLRGLAALGVVLFHVRTELWVGWRGIQAQPELFSQLDHLLAWLGIPMRFMGAGVLLFFVISGYCIHRPQAEKGKAEMLKAEMLTRESEIGTTGRRDDGTTEKVGKGKAEPDWWKFYVRRFLRIAPPYWVALALSAGVLVITGGISEAGWERVASSAAMLQNYWGTGGQISTNPSLWSLPVELELYLIYPLACWIGSRVGWTWMLVMAVVVSLLAQWSAHQGLPKLDGSFPKFWGMWCAGAWLAEQKVRNRLPAWSLGWSLGLMATLGLAVGAEMRPFLQPVSFWLWGGVGVLALLWAVAPRSSQETPSRLPTAWLAWIGTFSYSLYLIHYPLFQWAGFAWQKSFASKPASLSVALVAVAVAIPLALLFHRLIELPSHRLARRLGRV
jgi:peptidoglycan/LPS O-acetylase OafA/YrhL